MLHLSPSFKTKCELYQSTYIQTFLIKLYMPSQKNLSREIVSSRWQERPTNPGKEIKILLYKRSHPRPSRRFLYIYV